MVIYTVQYNKTNQQREKIMMHRGASGVSDRVCFASELELEHY
jgi:hypothetical protein